jgi:hypothetical protein
MALLHDTKITKVKDAQAAGTSAINSTSVDMAGYDSACFIVSPGTITSGAVTSINLAQSSDNVTFNDLLGSGITIADDDDNQTFALEVVKPSQRYVRLEVARATQNAVIGDIYCIQRGPGVKPQSNNVADTITSELHQSPAEGTA